MLYYLLLIAISLSLDAFSLSLSIGGMISLKNKLILALSVGIFHFVMPTLGKVLGNSFFELISINLDIFTFVIFLYISLIMFKEFISKEENNFNFNILNVLVFSFGVSLDSFGVGMTLQDTFYIKFIVFSIVSFIFTIIGLLFSDKLKHILKNYSLLLGSILMLILSMVNLCKLFI